MKPKIAKVLSTLEGDIGEFAKRLLPKPPVPKRVYDNSKVSDHHAIVPTGVPASSKTLSPDEAKIFDMAARRLVAALYPDHKYRSTRILTECEGHLFRSTGTQPVEAGWKEVYHNEKDAPKDADEEQLLPESLKEGDLYPVKGTSIAQKKEKPPARLTTASLLGLMENAGKDIENEELRDAMKDSGLGTPATRAAIIERLEEVGYIRTQGKSIVSTDKGRRLIAVVPQEMSSAETTGRWERALNKMARAGSKDAAAALYEKFMGSIRRYSAFLVESADRADPNAGFEPEPYRGKGGKTSARKSAPAYGKASRSAGSAGKSVKSRKSPPAAGKTPRSRKAPSAAPLPFPMEK